MLLIISSWLNVTSVQSAKGCQHFALKIVSKIITKHKNLIHCVNFFFLNKLSISVFSVQLSQA